MLQLDSVCQNEWHIIRELSPYHYTVSLYFAVRQRNDFLDRLVNVEPVFSRRRFLSQRADSADDFDG